MKTKKKKNAMQKKTEVYGGENMKLSSKTKNKNETAT